MPKTRQQKEITVDSLAQGLKQAKGVVFANFQGLTVAQSEDLRKKCRQEGIKVLAAKKTLLQRALELSGLKEVDSKSFQGGVATFLAEQDEVAAARVVNAFSKDHELVSIFGGVLEGKYLSVEMVKSLARLPGRTELLSKMVGSLNAPVSGFVNVLAGNLRNLIGVLQNIKNAKTT
jgi:large subunit ribosomal protein L10